MHLHTCPEILKQKFGSLTAHPTPQDLREMFGAFGTVQECRILHRGEDIRGAGALVRMNSISAASQAILALNGYLPRSQVGEFSSMPLLVRFADSPEEKARKQARKDQLAGRQHRSVSWSSIAGIVAQKRYGGGGFSFSATCIRAVLCSKQGLLGQQAV